MKSLGLMIGNALLEIVTVSFEIVTEEEEEEVKCAMFLLLWPTLRKGQ